MINISLWPDIDAICIDENKEKIQQLKNVKIPADQLFSLYQKKKELEQIISDTQHQLEDLTEENVQLHKKIENKYKNQPVYDETSEKSQNVLQEKEKTIKKLKTRLSQKDLEIVKLMGQKNEKLKEIANLKKKLKKSDTIIPEKEINETSIDSNIVARLNAKIEQYKYRI